MRLATQDVRVSMDLVSLVVRMPIGAPISYVRSGCMGSC
jgi:hypothetical protein